MFVAKCRSFAMVATVTLAACGGGWLGEDATVDDRIVNWPQDTTSVMSASVSGSAALTMGTVNADGTFSVKLPTGDEMAAYLGPYAPQSSFYPKTGSCAGQITVEPQDAKAAALELRAATPSNNNTIILLHSAPEDTNIVSADYLYFDKEVRVNGKIQCSHDYFFFTTHSDYVYDMHFQPGWNIQVTDTSRTSVNNPPHGVNWRANF